jgi:hypothetical protein
MSFWRKFETNFHTLYIQQKLEDFYIYTTVKKLGCFARHGLDEDKMITA